MSSSSPRSAVAVGDVVLDRYRVVEQIAAGGHSVVYRGTDERLSRPVCIKVFSGFGGESGVGRTSYEHFVQEAFALSRLTHPNTLRIYDFGHLVPKEVRKDKDGKDLAGMPLQVCEFMNGGTLSNVIREQGKQSLADTTRVVIAMCAALGEAHGLGIVHRDIKPQNILFGNLGASRLPKLADFGIAKWSADADERSGQRAEDTAIVAGQKLAMYSPSWAAPEQLAGQPVSPATDIYSLACVAVYMLSTRAVFADEDVYAGYKKRRHASELVRDTLGPIGIPARVIELLSRALAFDPKQRPGKVDELSGELTAAVLPPPPPPIEPPPVPFANEPTASRSSITPMSALPTPPRPVPAPPREPMPREPMPPTTAAKKRAVHDPVREARDFLLDRNVPDRDEATPGEQVPPAIPSAIAPTPPVVPSPAATAAANQQATWTPPVVVPPWMSSAPDASGHIQRLPLSDVPTVVGDRRVHFVMVANNVADLVGPSGSKVRITLMPGPTGRVVHVKGLSCFVSMLGGRPSPAVTLERSGDVALVTPRAQEVGHIRISTAAPQSGRWVFPLGANHVAITIDDCSDPILFDFGPGSDAYLIYTRGRTLPKRR